MTMPMDNGQISIRKFKFLWHFGSGELKHHNAAQNTMSLISGEQTDRKS